MKLARSRLTIRLNGGAFHWFASLRHVMDRVEQAEILWDQATSTSLESDAEELMAFNKNLTSVTRGLHSLEKAFGKNELKVRNRLAYHLGDLEVCNETLSLKDKRTENLVKAKVGILVDKLRGIEVAVKSGNKSITQKQAFTHALEQGENVSEDFQSLYQEIKRRMLDAKRRENAATPHDVIAGLQELAIQDVDPDEIRAMYPDDALELIQSEIKRIRKLTKGKEGDQTDKLNHILGVYTQLRKELSENQSAERAFKELRHITISLLLETQSENVIEAPILITQHNFSKRAFSQLHDDDYDISTVMSHYIFLRNAELVGVREDIIKQFADPSEAITNALTRHHINPQRNLVRIGNPVKYASHWYAPVFPERVKSLIRIYKWGLATDKLR